ncbi:MAG: peroxiredoxin family protein [Cellvibrionaceae bacterium]
MSNQQSLLLAPPLDTVEWINSAKPLTLSELKGKVVVIHAFQMLCPGCVSHGIPQASSIYKTYSRDEVQVIGLHAVFEHHDVMTSKALKAFVHEYRLSFPIAIDKPSDNNAIPCTMTSFQMKGTPTLIILDKNGYLRVNYFGRMNDMQVGSIIGGLLEEKSASSKEVEITGSTNHLTSLQCGNDGCLI